MMAQMAENVVELARTDLAPSGGEPVAASKAMRRIIRDCKIIGGQNGPVVIMGESGTGKTHLSKIIHQSSYRSRHPFIPVNCGELHEHTLEATLFGHTRDAYTSARTDQKGFFVEADGGTLVLDDVDCLPLTAQARLLRFLDDGGFYRLGEPGRLQKADVRVIVTSNKDLELWVQRGHFRHDLWYRIRRWQIIIPPLAKRPEDACVLARRFLQEVSQTSGYSEPLAFTPQALDLLSGINWEDNVRGLRRAVEHIAVFGDQNGCKIDADVAARVLFNPNYGLVRRNPSREGTMHETLIATGWNISLTARLLGCSRTTVHDRIRKNGWANPQTL